MSTNRVIWLLILCVAPFALPVSGVAHASTASSDIGVTQRANRSVAKIGDLITFTSTVTNHGPSAAVDMNAEWVTLRHLQVVSQSCDAVSPDTPGCEWGGQGPFATNALEKMYITAKVLQIGPGN